MEKEELVSQLKKITLENGPDTNYEYERKLTILVGREFKSTEPEDAYEILNDYIHKDDEKRKIAYSAFYCLIIFYRHQFNNKALDELWENYAKIFANFPDSSLFNDFNNFDKLHDYRSLSYLYNLRFLSNLNIAGNDYVKDLKHLNLAEKNIKIDNYSEQNAGYRHALSSLYISIYEKYEGNPEVSEEIKNSKWYNVAKEEVNDAIKLQPNSAVFRCTHGRILSIQGKTIEAEKEINTAISMEDDAREDYSLRINRYQYYKLLNQMRGQVQFVQEKVNEANESIDKVKGDLKDTEGNYLTIKQKMKYINDNINIIINALNNATGNYLEINRRIVTTKNEVINRVNSDLKVAKGNYLAINKEMEKTKDEIKESRVSNIEIIGLFSGVVSFIIGSFNIVTTFSAVEAGFLILTLMGCLTGVLSVFSLLLHGGYNERKEESSDEKQNNKEKEKNGEKVQNEEEQNGEKEQNKEKGQGGEEKKNKEKIKNREKIPYIIIICCSLFLTIGSIFAMKFFSFNSEAGNTSQNTSITDANVSSNI